MELGGYGLLIGKITGSRPQRRGNPHWLLVMQPGDPDHPSYRIAVNLQTTEKKKAPELQYQIIDFNRRSTKAGDALIKALTKLAPTRYFFSPELYAGLATARFRSRRLHRSRQIH